MSITMIRVAEGKNTTLSHLYLNNIFCCFLLEDCISEKKLAGKTCIPEGNYPLKINRTAGMNTSYKSRFPEFHKGMIEVDGIPGFDLVFFHIGNFHRDTAGCPLTGHYWNLVKGDYQVAESAFAYKIIYPRLLHEIELGNSMIQVMNEIWS